MSSLSVLDATFIGTVIESLFYGLYCIVFVLYIQIHTSKKNVHRNILIYPLSTLFLLCTVYFVLDFTQQYLTIMHGQSGRALVIVWHLNITTSAIYSFVDFIAQAILIYRCWVVWSRQLLVVIVPSILAIITLATSLTLVGELRSLGETPDSPPSWFYPMGVLSFSLSLAVNAIFTALLVFKIAKASLSHRSLLSRNEQRSNDLRPLMSILIESGIVLFVVQLIWVIFFHIQSSGYYLIGGPIVMIFGITPTIIVVRVAMQDTHENQKASVESNMQFALADENSPTKISDNTFHLTSRGSQTFCSQDSKETQV